MTQARPVMNYKPVCSEALELEVERVWCALTHKPATLSLLPTGRIVQATEANACVRAEEIGRYTKAIALADFRADVFFAFEQTHGRRGP